MGCCFQLSEAQKTLLGIMIIKFATGFTSDWGVINLYVLSYYHFKGAPIEIKASTNSLLMIILVIPVTFCLIIATKVASYVGNTRLIRICSIAYLVLPMLSFISFRFEIFIFSNLIAPCSAFALSLVPIFFSMYSHYGENKSLATGAVIGSFGVGAIVWNLVATLGINPQNVIPDIPTSDPNVQFFDQSIAEKVPFTIHLIYLISGILFVIGGHMITTNDNYKDPENVQINLDIDHEINEGYQHPNNTISTVDRRKINIKAYMKHPIVILLFLMNITGCMFQVYVQLNTKLIYMPILQDDHLISIGLIVIIMSSALFSVPWGLLADKQGSAFTIIVFSIVDLSAKIYACLNISRMGFVISMILIGGTDKTMLILFAPILIDSFGLQVATQLLPLKGISGILSVVFAAAIGLACAGMRSQNILFIILILSFINLALGIILWRIIKNRQKDNLQGKFSIENGENIMEDNRIQ